MTLVDLQDNLGLLEALVSELRRDPFDSTKREAVLASIAACQEAMAAVKGALTREPEPDRFDGPEEQAPSRRMAFVRGGQEWREVVR